MNPLERLLRRKGAYRELFRGPTADIVLADLAYECRAYRTTHVREDALDSARWAGRREVWLHLQHMIQASDAHIRKLLERETDAE